MYLGTSGSSPPFGARVCYSGSDRYTQEHTTTGNNFFVQFISDSTTHPGESGFKFTVITGKENCKSTIILRQCHMQ